MARYRRLALCAALMGCLMVAAACGSGNAATGDAVKMTVVHTSSGVVEAAYVPVTVDGHRYAFVVDSGAARTVIKLSVANALGLPTTGSPLTGYSLGCALPTELRQVRSFALGSHVLALPQIATQAIDQEFGKVDGLTVAGLLGSDALSSFGSVHLDFKAQTLTLGAVPPANAPAIPLSVQRENGEVVPRASLSVSSSPAPVTVMIDTGATKSYLATSTASTLGLTPAGPHVSLGTPGCGVSAQAAPLDGAKLGPEPIDLPVVLVGPSQIAIHDPQDGGLVGDDVLGLSGEAWLDYAGQKLVLG